MAQVYLQSATTTPQSVCMACAIPYITHRETLADPKPPAQIQRSKLIFDEIAKLVRHEDPLFTPIRNIGVWTQPLGPFQLSPLMHLIGLETL